MIDIEVIDADETDEFGDPKKQVFTIHYNILAHFSLSFRRTLNTDLKCNMITIHSCQSAFGLFQNWFYTQKIQGLTSTIKLLEYAKLWQLASTLAIKDLAPLLLGLMDTTKPGIDDEKGDILKDFQSVAYISKYRGLKDMTVENTLSAMNELDINRILKDILDVMRPSFMLNMMKGWVALLR